MSVPDRHIESNISEPQVTETGHIPYSLIIPHRNRPQLLERLLNSVPRRDDMQIIIVDDHSDAGTVDFSRFTKSGHPHVEIVQSEECRGAGHARNLGLAHAKGEWLLFADCDDYYLSDAFSNLLDQPIPQECDVLVWHSEILSSHSRIAKNPTLDTFERHTDCDRLYLDYLPVWTKMVRRSIVEDCKIRFEETMHANDVMFAAKLSQCVSCYYTVSNTLYVYDTASSGLTKSRKLKNILERTQTEVRALRYLKTKGKFLWHGPYWFGELCRKNYHVYLGFCLWCMFVLGRKYTGEIYRTACKSVGVSPTPYKTFVKLKGRWIG